jgi:hypothetical protein
MEEAPPHSDDARARIGGSRREFECRRSMCRSGLHGAPERAIVGAVSLADIKNFVCVDERREDGRSGDVLVPVKLAAGPAQ